MHPEPMKMSSVACDATNWEKNRYIDVLPCEIFFLYLHLWIYGDY
jgi:hypothetical protein